MEQINLGYVEQGRQAERRQRSRRFVVVAPARFSWLDADGVWHAGKGTTRDISLHGVFITTHPVPVPGSAVEVTITIPPLTTAVTAMRLTGAGSVLRIEPPDSQPKGFVAEVSFQATGIGAPFDSDSET